MPSIPLIADPLFWALAVPAVLLMGLSKSGFATGFGALAVPLMALAIPVPQAAAVMMPLLLVMDAATLHRLYRHPDWRLLRLLLPWGLLGTLFGWAAFGLLPAAAVSALTGTLALAFVANQVLQRRSGARAAPDWVGRLCGAASGFTSFVAHAGGPPVLAYLLPRRMPPLVFGATMAVFFAALNASKWVPYALLGLIDLGNMLSALLLLPLAPAGVWIGVWLTRRIAPTWFYRFAWTGMALAGAKLLWDGLR
jgi:uncharacterized membrane protein YfcA